VIAPVRGKVLSPRGECHILSEPLLVLAANEALDYIEAIPIKVRRSKGRCYFASFQTLPYEKVSRELELESPTLTLSEFQPRAITTLTDDDLVKKFSIPGRRQTVALLKLEQRWSMIEPIVIAPVGDLLFDRQYLAEVVDRRANELAEERQYRKLFTGTSRLREGRDFPAFVVRLARVRSEILRLLNQYWAGGSVRGALIGFNELCGGRGKNRKLVAAKSGPHNALVKQGRLSEGGLVITHESEHAENIRFSYRTYVVRGVTVAKALRRMWDEFYSREVQQADGSLKREWIPRHERPTRAQFVYWGTKQSPEQEAWRKHLPPTKFDKSYRAIMGSSTDDVYAVGQRGGIDSTPPDIQFVRAIDRRARVGGGYRILLVDSLFGYIPGLYMGFDAPSGTTVRLALYNSIDPDKRGWLEELGLPEIPPEDFIPMWFQNLWCDNTDVRCDEVMFSTAETDTNLHFIPKLHSELNGTVESKHHVVHRLADHNLLGTTFGQPRSERGEKSATERARHTLMDGMRETVRAIWVHNTEELGVARPLRMRLKDVPPTRLHMTREMIRLGKVVRANHAVQFARNHLLPRMQGTFTEKGVRLHVPDTGDKPHFLRRVRYVSDHPIIRRWCELARRGGKDDPDYFRKSFIVNGCRMKRIWYLDLDTMEAIELEARSTDIRDPDLLTHMTIPDLVDAQPIEAAERLEFDESRQRKLAAMEAEQERTKDEAQSRYRAAVEAHGGEPTKSEMRSQKRANREAEKTNAVFGVPMSTATPPPLDPGQSNETEPAAVSARPLPKAPALLQTGGESLLRAAVRAAR